MEPLYSISILFINLVYSSLFDKDDFHDEKEDYRRSDQSQGNERRSTDNLERELQNMKSQFNSTDLSSPFQKDFYSENHTTANRSQVSF